MTASVHARLKKCTKFDPDLHNGGHSTVRLNMLGGSFYLHLFVGALLLHIVGHTAAECFQL
jgi:hypothetical protein